MESASSHDPATTPAGGAGRVVVSVPRWIEVKDQRAGAEHVDPSRTRHYVVSPHLSAFDAKQLAQSYAQRDRLEKTYQSLDVAQTPVTIVTAALLIVIVIQQYPLWLLVVPAILFVGHQFLYNDCAQDLRKPFDVAALENDATERMFHKIPPLEFAQINRLAERDHQRGVEAHLAMWRAYELASLYQRAGEDLKQLNAKGADPYDIHVVQRKLTALHELVITAHAAMSGMINPRKRHLTIGREGLAELVRQIDDALKSGLDGLREELRKSAHEARERQDPLPDPDEVADAVVELPHHQDAPTEPNDHLPNVTAQLTAQLTAEREQGSDEELKPLPVTIDDLVAWQGQHQPVVKAPENR
ncbi:hypothetical protein [Jonesia quinghaiensis]|uniref:hypothetical protein n=1 Tax=Jonesia quinghaiensis TaxID=262806 RepID=UPI00048A53EF|nr:hypothetical protein [Jonesia quinghaiensis]